MQNPIADLQDFHRKFKHPIGHKPQIPPADRKLLRYRLIKEEVYDELLKAIYDDDMVEIADGICDAIYVLIGCALEYGIPLGELWNDVQRANMSKSTEKNEYGKTIKGKDFVPPKTEEILIAHGWDGGKTE